MQRYLLHQLSALRTLSKDRHRRTPRLRLDPAYWPVCDNFAQSGHSP